MSLVNDMLKDLDASSSSNASNIPSAGLNDTRPAETWLPALLAFVVVGVLAAYQVLKSTDADVKGDYVTDSATVMTEAVKVAEAVTSSDATDQSASATAEPISSSTVATVPNYYAEAQQANSGASPENAAGVKDTPTEAVNADAAPTKNTIAESNAVKSADDKATRVRITQLLQKAEQALSIDRLTSPADDNAYSYYQQVLQLQPQHPAASDGIEQIIQRYLVLSEEYTQEGNIARAKTLLSRAESLMPSHPKVQQAWQRVSVQTPLQNTVTADSSQTSTSITNALTTNASTSVDVDRSVSKSSEASSQQAQPNNEKPLVRVVPSRSMRDMEVAEQARSTIAAGNGAAAKRQLELFIAGSTKSKESFDVLFSLLVEQGEREVAKFWLEQQATHLDTEKVAYYMARLLVLDDELHSAISLLEGRLSQALEDSDYLSLLAGLYYQVDKNAESVRTYQRLLRLQQNNAQYWLGYALALDSLEETASALNAYRKAQQLSSEADDSKVQRYIADRIQALSSNSSE